MAALQGNKYNITATLQPIVCIRARATVFRRCAAIRHGAPDNSWLNALAVEHIDDLHALSTAPGSKAHISHDVGKVPVIAPRLLPVEFSGTQDFVTLLRFIAVAIGDHWNPCNLAAEESDRVLRSPGDICRARRTLERSSAGPTRCRN